MDRFRVRSSTAVAVTTACVGASLFVLGLSSGFVLAAPPSNDVFGGATDVAVGFSETLDTTEATADADDQQANAVCGAPATDASVWYAFTPTDDVGVIVDVSGSDYSAAVIVVSGAPGAFDLITCGGGAVAFLAGVGTTYYVMAFDDQLDGVGNGGSLQISFNAAPTAPPTIDVTVNPTGRFNKNGTATLHGTFTCTNATLVQIFGEVSQRVGKFTTGGVLGFSEVGSCDGTAHEWIADVIAESGEFRGGKSLVETRSVACGVFECADVFSSQTVQLKGGR